MTRKDPRKGRARISRDCAQCGKRCHGIQCRECKFGADRFSSKVGKSGDCWNWTGTMSENGYGTYWADGKNHRAHRYAYEMANGPIPDGLYIDHVCHNTACVNPAHLRLATPKQNTEHQLGAQTRGTSGFRGVSWHKRDKRWQATVIHHGKRVHIGYFHDREEAGAAARAKRNELFTHNNADRNAA